MAGFFSKSQGQSKSCAKGKFLSCISCGLYKDAKIAKQKPVGGFAKKIMNIWSTPIEFYSRPEIKREYRKIYKENGIDIDKDCINVMAVGCSTAKPEPEHVDACKKFVLSDIKEYKPDIIILHGQQALRSVLGAHWTKNLGDTDKWRGFNIPDRFFKAYICPMVPAWLIASDKEAKFSRTILEKDLKRALALVGKVFPIQYDEKEDVEIMYDEDSIREALVEFSLHDGLVSYDYETTGLKPHADYHQIVCVSVASKDRCISFMLDTKLKQKLIKKLLKNPNVKLTSHNMKYEHQWDGHFWNIDTDYEWDSMLAAHMLDNRKGVCSLKFQTYVRYGVYDYDSSINEYIKTKNEEDSNKSNKILSLLKKKNGIHELLLYCGLDSLYQNRLAYEQIEELGYEGKS